MMFAECDRHAVLRVAGLVVGLSLAIPLYYSLEHLVPGFGTLVPAFLAHGASAVGVFVAFPGMVVYAQRLERQADNGERDVPVEYDVNDRWERQNL